MYMWGWWRRETGDDDDDDNNISIDRCWLHHILNGLAIVVVIHVLAPPVTFYSLAAVQLHIGTINWLIKYWLYTHGWEKTRKTWWQHDNESEKSLCRREVSLSQTEQQDIMHTDIVDLLMSMTLTLACALITTAFRSKQTVLIHSLTSPIESWLILLFRSTERTYCYSSSHALTFTYFSNVKWLFIIVEQRNKKRKKTTMTATRVCTTILHYSLPL